jgi:hypothetical protein
MAVTSFDVDERTAALLAELQKTFGVKTNAAVLRKALALANVASQYADADNTITITPGKRERNWYSTSSRLSAISRALVSTSPISGTAPLV